MVQFSPALSVVLATLFLAVKTNAYAIPSPAPETLNVRTEPQYPPSYPGNHPRAYYGRYPGSPSNSNVNSNTNINQNQNVNSHRRPGNYPRAYYGRYPGYPSNSNVNTNTNINQNQNINSNRRPFRYGPPAEEYPEAEFIDEFEDEEEAAAQEDQSQDEKQEIEGLNKRWYNYWPHRWYIPYRHYRMYGPPFAEDVEEQELQELPLEGEQEKTQNVEEQELQELPLEGEQVKTQNEGDNLDKRAIYRTTYVRPVPFYGNLGTYRPIYRTMRIYSSAVALPPASQQEEEMEQKGE